MKLRTEIQRTQLQQLINGKEGIMLCGSCFTEHIGTWLQEAGLNVTCNPWGVLFNPASIAQSLQRIKQDAGYTPPIWRKNADAVVYSFDHHGSINAPDEEQLIQKVTEIEQQTRACYQLAKHLIITFGTAWVYEREGHIVANCHKAPAQEFVRRRLSVQEIVEMWEPLIDADKHYIFTVSPIRHIGDGLHGNQLSKATLLLAIEELQSRHPEQVEYLPVYELLIDDLRDYRFYADDLAHPSALAIEMVRELVAEVAFTPQLREYLNEVSGLNKTLAHKPSDPHAPAYLEMIKRTLEKKNELHKALK